MKNLDEKKIKEFNDYLVQRLIQRNAFQKKIAGIDKDIIQQLGDILLLILAKEGKKLKPGELGVYVGEEGFELGSKIHRRSRKMEHLMTIRWDGQVRIANRDKDYLGIIDILCPHLHRLFSHEGLDFKAN